MSAPPAVGGNRLIWEDLPPHVRAAIESAAGAPVRAATSQPGGFSPGLASVLRLAGGRSVFVKAVNASRNPDAPDMHRQEVRMLAALPRSVPTPRLLWSYDDGDWVALMTEAVDGTPPAQPWRPGELDLFLDAAARLAVQLTPAPVAATGTTLLHSDLRADNVLLTAGGAVIVDWPHACVGAAWIDLMAALPSVAMQGGGDPEPLWRRYPPARSADPDAVTAVLAALTGFFLWQAAQPPPPNLPRLRAFQQAQGEAGLAWLRHRLS